MDHYDIRFLTPPNETRVDDHHVENYNCTGVVGTCIERLTWGEITVRTSNGTTAKFKDAIIWWSGAKEWDWKIGDVHHNPGITVDALDQLLAVPGITDVILTRGMEGALKVPDKTSLSAAMMMENALKKDTLGFDDPRFKAVIKAGWRVHIAYTRDAAELYNKLIKEGKKVGVFMHSTC